MAKITVTISQKFNAIANVLAENGISTLTVGDESFDVAEFLADRISKVTKPKDTSKTAEKNAELAELAYEFISAKGKPVRASDLIGVEGIENTSKATVVLKVLVTDGRMISSKDKGVTYYGIAE